MLLIGLIGGIVLALLSAVLFFIGFIGLFAGGGGQTTVLLIASIIGIVTSIIGIVAGVTAEKKNEQATKMFFVAGLINLVTGFITSWPIALFGVLFLVGGYVGHRKKQQITTEPGM